MQGLDTGDDDVPRSVLARHLRRRRMPVRFLYAGRAADRHVQLAEAFPDEYLDGRSDHEVNTLAEVLGPGPVPRQLCDIGTSNGVHSAQLVTGLSRRGLGCRRYLGMDFSPRLLAAAEGRLASCTPVDRHFVQWDIENGPTGAISSWRRGDDGVVMALVGGTLGNVDDPARTLRHLRASCTAGDTLVLGVFLPPSPGEDVLGPYVTPAMSEMMLMPFRAVGLADHLLDLRVEFTGGAVTGTVRLRGSLVMDDVLPGGLHLTEGDEIECFRSTRFTPGAVDRLLMATGWQPLGGRADTADSYLVHISHPVI
ncbi:hypothetical protein [Streptomyces sp. NPDC060322]|uniref:class I SAM-dependent methyltransferase n=1 Tax=Streptomyces sp. NPDC060322 TaxID=3347097 RepID=UPI0036676A55